MKAIQKVMFKVQHEGESVKVRCFRLYVHLIHPLYQTFHDHEPDLTVQLIIPLEAVLDIEKTPTLEFAETIEIRCVDSDDQMSIDSYFFASFTNTGHAMRIIQKLLDCRPPQQLPRLSSDWSFESESEEPRRRKKSDIASTATAGLKKLGSVLKPLIGKSSEKDQNKEGQVHDLHATSSRETMRSSGEDRRSSFDMDTTAESEAYEGYPPRQSGVPPAGYGDEGSKTWSTWLKKPVSKVLGGPGPTASSKTSLLTRVSSSKSSIPQPGTPGSGRTRRTTRMRRGSEPVTEVVEPTVRDHDADDTDETDSERASDREGDGNDGGNEDDNAQSSSRRGKGSGTRKNRHKTNLSIGSAGTASSLTSGFGRGTGGEYSMVDASEQGKKEDKETERKFRSVFALPESEVLIEREWKLPSQGHNIASHSGLTLVRRLPRVSVSRFACFWKVLCVYQLLLFQIISAVVQDQGERVVAFGRNFQMIAVSRVTADGY